MIYIKKAISKWYENARIILTPITIHISSNFEKYMYWTLMIGGIELKVSIYQILKTKGEYLTLGKT